MLIIIGAVAARRNITPIVPPYGSGSINFIFLTRVKLLVGSKTVKNLAIANKKIPVSAASAIRRSQVNVAARKRKMSRFCCAR
jgi:hypothetical protein